MATDEIQLKRHYRTLSPKEADEVAGAMAGLIVGFLKGRYTHAGEEDEERRSNDD